MNKQVPIVCVWRIGRHIVTVAGDKPVTHGQAIQLLQGWKRAKVGLGARVAVGVWMVRVCRSVA